MKVMLRRTSAGLSLYIPKKDLEEPVVEQQHEALWGGWVKLKNGMIFELPEMAVETSLPITVNAKIVGGRDI
jgi:nitrogen fixation protein NifT